MLTVHNVFCTISISTCTSGAWYPVHCTSSAAPQILWKQDIFLEIKIHYLKTQVFLSQLRHDTNFCDIELYTCEGLQKDSPILAHRQVSLLLYIHTAFQLLLFRIRSDLEFQFPPCRNMLAAATPYFHAMFTSGLIESEFERTRLIESFVEVNLMVISQRFESLKKEKGQETER